MKNHNPIEIVLSLAITLGFAGQATAQTAADTDADTLSTEAPKTPDTGNKSDTAPQTTTSTSEETVAPAPQPALENSVAATAPNPPPVVETKAADMKPEEKKKPAKLQLATEDGNFTVSPLLLAQPVFVIPLDADADHPAEGSGVMLKRARLGFDATLFKIAKVKLWGDFRNGTPELVDAYADVDPLNGNLVIRFGWFRPWFGRQRLNSASNLQFVETAQAWSDRQFGLNLNRDMGVALHGMAADVFEWGIGLFNGEKSFSLAGNRDYGMAARFAVHPLSAASVGEVLKPGDETALKMLEKPALSIGSAVSFESRRDRSVTVDETTDPLPYEDVQVKVGGEVGFQWSRLSMLSEIFWMKTILNEGAEDDVTAVIDSMTPTAALRGTGMGAYFQTGVMVVKDILELAGRFDWVDEHMDTDGLRLYPAFETNIYLKGQNLKLQAFYRADIAAGYDEDHSNWSDKPTHLIEILLQAGF